MRYLTVMLILLSAGGVVLGAEPTLVPGSRIEVNWEAFISRHDLVVTKPAEDSYRGLLLGNGDIGVSLYGRPDVLTLHVGKNDIWDYRDPMDEQRPVRHRDFLAKYADPTKPPVKNYIWNAKSDPWNVKIRKTYGRPMPTLKPAGKIRFRTKQTDAIDYAARLRLWDAEVATEFAKGKPSLKTYVSYPRNLIVCRYDPGDVKGFDIELARHQDATGAIPNAPEFGVEGRDIWVRYRFPADRVNYPDGFEYVMYGRLLGGDQVRTEAITDFQTITQSKWREGTLGMDRVKTTEGVAVAHIGSSKPVTLLVAVVTTRDHERPFEHAKQQVREAARKGEQQLTREHRKWWHDYWKRSLVELSGRPFLNRTWLFSQYLLACSWRPGRLAPGLFGAWTWEDHPPFGNDYHWDYNMQQAVWGAYSSNRLEQAIAYNETTLRLLPTAIIDAKETYGIDGAKFFLTSYPRKYGHNPFPLLHYDKMMSLNGWVAHPMWWYYLYSQDEEYLRRQAYPLMRECAKFYEGYLTRADDGRYDIWPTAAWDVAFTPHLKSNRNFPMDLSFIRYLMKACVQASEILEVDNERRTAWREIVANLREYPTGKATDGTVFTAYPGSTSTYHFPLTAVMVFPGDDIGLGSPRHLQEIARRTVAPMKYSGDEQLMKAVIRARLGIDHLDAFEKQLQATTRPNGTLSYGKQWFFWVHGSGNSIWHNDNLMQSYDGRIRLAPVKLQTRAVIVNLRAVGAFLVSADIGPGGNVAYATIMSEAGRRCMLVRPWAGDVRIRTWPSLKSVAFDETDGVISFATRRGATYVVDNVEAPWEKHPIHRLGGQ